MMNKSVWALVITIFFSNTILAQQWLWGKGGGGLGNDGGSAVTIDNDGNVYATGNLAGVGTFDGVYVEGNGIFDALLIKYDSDGNLVWAKTAGGIGDDKGLAIHYDGQNSFYVAGYFSGTSFFDNQTVISNGATDAFLAKYDLDGKIIWVRSIGGPAHDLILGITTDENGNVYACGSFDISVRVNGQTYTGPNLFSQGFVWSLTPAGATRWFKHCVGEDANIFTGLSADKLGNIYASGFFARRMSYDSLQVQSVSPSSDVSLLKIDLNGNGIWLKRAGGSYPDAASAVKCDPQGNPVIVGYFSGTATFDNQSITFVEWNDAFVAKYNPVGECLWARGAGGTKLDAGNDIDVDDQGNIYITGMFDEQALFGNLLVNDEDRTAFIASYYPDGNIRWVNHATGRRTHNGIGIAVDKEYNVVFTGYYLFRIIFGPHRPPLTADDHFFIAKYQQPPINVFNTSSANGLNIFPNPVSNILLISIEDSEMADLATALIYDVNGKLVKESVIESFKIDVGSLMAGSYLLTIKMPDKVYNRPFIKQP